jgi:hypothetical protein
MVLFFNAHTMGYALEREHAKEKNIGGCCRPKPTDGHRQATRELGGPEPLSVRPASRMCPNDEVRWACHLTYT